MPFNSKKTIRKLEKKIIEAKQISLPELRAWALYELGISKTTVDTYTNALQTLNKVEVNSNTVKPSKGRE